MEVLRFDHIKDVALVKPLEFRDARGWFSPHFDQKRFEAEGIKDVWVQDNRSRSSKGVLRGLHFQMPPFAQAKLVTCVRGSIYDVVVDVRKDSLTFGKWAGFHLNEDNRVHLYVPTGFAHGFLVLSEEADVFYKVSDYYNPKAEGGLLWSDPSIGIKWEEVWIKATDSKFEPVIHERDNSWPGLDGVEWKTVQA